MMKSYTFTLSALLYCTGISLQAQTILYEGFDDVAGLTSAGWVAVNNSAPQGPDSWSQADGGMVAVAYSGDTLSYVQSSFQATDPNGTGVISDWLISPAVMLNDGDSISVQALSFNSATFPDRVEVRISPNGGSDVGSDENSVGDFGNLVFSINPNLDNMSFPSIQVDGSTWTRFAGEITGLGGMTSCRVAIRYWVDDAGGTGNNSSTVGIDDLDVFSGASTASVGEFEGFSYSFGPNPVNERLSVQTDPGSTLEVSLFSVSGQRIFIERSSGMLLWDMRDLPVGVYVLELRDTENGSTVHERIVKH
ncbi:MAG: T9SS type A sorting domain-containing protein [Flavobacteriales bacterium]|nr:T9SS type A sorting domain-containing protein [Flavobacteriales bacterium]